MPCFFCIEEHGIKAWNAAEQWDIDVNSHGAEDANGDLINPEDGVNLLEQDRNR